MVRLEFGGHSYDLDGVKFAETNVLYLALILCGCLVLKFMDNLVAFVERKQQTTTTAAAAAAAMELDKDTEEISRKRQ